MLLGINECHTHRIIHRDIKPQNMLLTKSLQLKIADFGLARKMSQLVKQYTDGLVTLWYRPPEILLGSSLYSTQVDMWSIGCVIYEIYHKEPLFVASSEINTIYRIFELLGTPSSKVWPGVEKLKKFKTTFPQFKGKSWKEICKKMPPMAIDLISKLVEYDPTKRF